MSEHPDSSFAALFEEQERVPARRSVRLGDRVEATVVHAGRDTVFVEFDGKRQGFFETEDLRNEDGTVTVVPGDPLRGEVVEVDDRQTMVRLRRVRPAARGERRSGHEGAEASSERAGRSSAGATRVPWAGLDLVVGRVVTGTVTRATEFGRFVRLAPSLEALLHVSEVGQADRAEEGQEIRVVVKKVDPDTRRVSLALAPEGAEVGAMVLPKEILVGSVVTATVERHENYGIFVQVEGTKGRAGRGLVPNGELGVARGTDLRKAFAEGSTLVAKVLETGEGRLRLSVKGAKADEERAEYDKARGQASAPASFGTFADLFNASKR